MKKFLVVLLMLTLAVSAAGCKNSGAVKLNSVKEIRVMTNMRASMDVMNRLIADYNKENKDGIRIKYEVKGDDISDLLKVSYLSKNAPDIHGMLSGYLGKSAIENGWLRPLDDDLIKKYAELFGEQSIKKQIDGRVYSVAINAGATMKFIWNKDLFKECGLDPETPPETWDQVRSYAKTITQKGGGIKYGFALPLKQPIFIRYYVMIPGAPSGYFNQDGYNPATGKFDFNIFEPMTTLYRNMKNDGSLFPTPSTLDNDSARSQFAEGNVGMMTAEDWDVGVFSEQFVTKNDWGIADFPTFDGLKGAYPASYSGNSSFVMNASSTNKEEQLKVWEWLISKDVLKELQLSGKGVYQLKSIMSKEYMSDAQKGNVEFHTLPKPAYYIDNGPTPLASIKLEGDDAYTTMASLISGTDDVKTALSQLTDKYNASLDKAIADGLDMNDFIIKDFDPTVYYNK